MFAILQGGRREDPLLEGNELEINQGGIGLRATKIKFCNRESCEKYTAKKVQKP